MLMPTLSLRFEDPRHRALLPRSALKRWVVAALQQGRVACKVEIWPTVPDQIAVRFLPEASAQALNRDYRGKDYATNVLTFAYDDNPQATIVADLALCSAVIEREAEAQGKSVTAHTAHLLVHGVLHALGFAHERVREATRMEALERDILRQLGFADPYAAVTDEATPATADSASKPTTRPAPRRKPRTAAPRKAR